MDQSSIWDKLFNEINSTDAQTAANMIETTNLMGAAFCSISAIDALEQMQPANSIESYFDANITIPTQITGCYSCGGDLRIKNRLLTCQSCGLEISDAAGLPADDESSSSLHDSNVNDKSFISMRVVGPGSYGYNRNLLKNCAVYTKFRKMTTLKELHIWNSQSHDNQLPKHIIEMANDMFAMIKENGNVYRKDVKKGVQAACLYYTCHMNGISKTPSEIAAIVGIDEKFLSAGDRILRDLNERSVIYIPAKINVIANYINRYFELLNINPKYKQFIFDIIDQADDDRLHVLFDSKDNTKCVGAIYLLIDRVKSLRTTIDKDKLGSECNISKTTFIKYHNMINKYYKKFIHIFIKHDIPLKSAWRSDIEYALKNKPKKIIKTKTKTKPIVIAKAIVMRKSTRLQTVKED